MMANYKGILIYVFFFVLHVVCAVDYYLEVNYDVDKYKFLHVNQTLEIICKNLVNRDPPSWTYPRRMANNPRVKFYIDIGESRMVISKAEAEDAGKYGCSSEQEYQRKMVPFNKEIEIVVNEIDKVDQNDETKGSIKLLCSVHAYPSPEIYWKIEHMANYKGKKILIYVFAFVLHVVCAEKHDYIEVNYDVDVYKILHVNETLELICKNKINTSPPSWYYHKRLHNDPRMKVSADGNQSRMVISNAQAEDAGKFRCEIEHEYEGKTKHFSKEIEVVVNEIYKVEQEETEDSIKLLCTVKAYPSPHVTWQIDYDKETLNPLTEAPDLNGDYWMPTDPRVEVHKSNGRFTLRPYKEVNNAELIIANVTDDDNGKYYCFARNLVGDRSKDFTVNRTKRGVAAEGFGAGMITLILVASFVLVSAVLGALLAFRQVHSQKNLFQKEVVMQEECIGRLTLLMDCNDVFVKA